MALRTELELGRSHFQKNWKKTVSDVKRGSRDMKRETGGVGKSLATGIKAALPAIGLAGIGAMVKSSLQWADDLADLTQKLNESAEVLQRVDYAAQQAASVGVAQISKAMLKLEDNLGDVSNTKVTEALNNIGISAKDLIGLPLDEKVKALSSAFQEARRTGVGVADMTELIGRQAGELIPLLNLSKEELDGLFADAPQLADDVIQRMARLNDEFDALVLKGKSKATELIDYTAIGVDFFVKFISGPAFESPQDAYDRAVQEIGDKMMEDGKSAMKRQESKAANAASVESTRQKKEDEVATAALNKELEKLAKIHESLANAEIDLLPDEAKIVKLGEKLKAVIEDAMGANSNFSPSLIGLQSMADAAQDVYDRTGKGLEKVTAAYEALSDARDIARDIEGLEEGQDADAAAKKKELIAAREQAKEGEFELLLPEEQLRRMREQLSESLGVDLNGSADLEKGLDGLRKEVEKARAAGDVDAERSALDRLNETQDQVQEFTKAAGAADSGEGASQPVGAIGEVGALFNQIMGRDPQAQQLDRLDKIGRAASNTAAGIDVIIGKMDEPPVKDIFDDF